MITKKNNKKAVIANTNTPELKIAPKKQPYLEQYLDLHIFKHRPVTEAFLDGLAEELVKWFTANNEMLLVTDFLEAKHINRTSFYRWLKMSEKLKEAHEFVTMVLCNRRENGALRFKLNANMVIKVHGHYSDIWQDEIAKIAALGLKDEDKKQNITVIIPPFESK